MTFEKDNALNYFQLPCRNIMSHSWKKRSSRLRSNTPLIFSEQLIFFLHTRQQLAQDIIEKLPSEIYHKIFQTPSTAETRLLYKINQLHHTIPRGSYPVIKPESSILRLLLTPDTPQSEKIWTIENGLCYGLVSYSYLDRIHLFPTLTTASLKLRNLCSDKLYFRFLSTPPTWENEEYKPAQHLVFITEYFGWWDSQPTQFLTIIGVEFYTEKKPIPLKVSSMNLDIDEVFIQLQIQNWNTPRGGGE